jgi:Cys-tRNA(Pro) deacylase
MTLATATHRVIEAAAALGLSLENREFPEGTRTAIDAANAIGVEVGQIVKTLVFLAGDQPVICLISGANNLDPQRLAEVAGVTAVRRADADEVRAATGYAVGGVPPFGHTTPMPVYCDRDLLQHETVWAAAGTPTSVFSIAPAALVDACGATLADLRKD